MGFARDPCYSQDSLSLVRSTHIWGSLVFLGTTIIPLSSSSSTVLTPVFSIHSSSFLTFSVGGKGTRCGVFNENSIALGFSLTVNRCYLRPRALHTFKYLLFSVSRLTLTTRATRPSTSTAGMLSREECRCQGMCCLLPEPYTLLLMRHTLFHNGRSTCLLDTLLLGSEGLFHISSI